MDEREKIRNEDAWLGRINKAKDEKFRQLIKRVERQSEKKKEPHASASTTTAAQRSQRSGCAAIAPTVGRCRQQRAHFS